MRNKRSGRKPAISHQVRAQRRRVWARRAVTLAVVIAAFVGWQLYLDHRYAGHRQPAVALAEGGQVFDDAQAALQQTDVQLALTLTSIDEPEHDLPGPISPSRISLRKWDDATYAYYQRHSGRGRSASVSRTGAPVLTPSTTEITGHRLDGRGRVAEITLECTYGLYWDEAATAGRVVAGVDPFPPPTTAPSDQKPRYSGAYEVVDVLTMRFVTAAGQWRPSEVQRLASKVYD